MATYIITDRNFNIQATRSAKDVLEIVQKAGAAKIMAPAEAPKKSNKKAAPAMKEVVLAITTKTREVLNNGEVIGKIEGLRDPSGKAERHVPYFIELGNGKKVGLNEEGVGRFTYQKDLLAALTAGELDEELKAALAEPMEAPEEKNEPEVPEGTLVMSDLTVQNLRKRIYADLVVELFGKDGGDWKVKIVVHH